MFLLISLVIHSKTFYSMLLNNQFHFFMGTNNDHHDQITACKFDNVLSLYDSDWSGFDYVLQVAGWYGNR